MSTWERQPFRWGLSVFHTHLNYGAMDIHCTIVHISEMDDSDHIILESFSALIDPYAGLSGPSMRYPV